ncbi:glycosyltransferase family 4 protein [Microlunatus flavus]|uniref:Glycosyltransferase involved in cell wall bisynthesis n=1 Tax=Microlunatus flavus TaxID=1036181 RepID=A0A1H8ZC53_9ACTN|nr:glycosyltransferase family 4 protein [Microlunatus flavus]SEP61951.1 Glycosyltransferase involved in cell wall bisynthesis [Microlunatus flavus]
MLPGRPTPDDPRAGTTLIFIHPSDELYGADRMLLEMVDAARADARVGALEVWLPTDLTHPEPAMALCGVLEGRGVRVRHLDLPVLRRAYRTPVGLARLAARGARLLVELRRAQASVVYCTSSATLLAAPVARLAGVRQVVGHVQEIWSAADLAALAGPARACGRLVAISKASAASLPGWLGRRTTVVANGSPDPGAPEPLAGRTGPLRFVVASRWNGWKGHATLLAAWDAAGAPGRLVVLGGPPASGDRTDVPALVAGLGDPGSVEVVGEVPDPSPWLRAADVVVMPSDRPEPFGLVAIEAFARARPVVASAAGGLLDVVTPEVDGWLFGPGEVDTLAAVLRRLDRATVERAGERARATYEERFTERAFAQRWRSAVLGGLPAVGR